MTTPHTTPRWIQEGPGVLAWEKENWMRTRPPVFGSDSTTREWCDRGRVIDPLSGQDGEKTRANPFYTSQSYDSTTSISQIRTWAGKSHDWLSPCIQELVKLKCKPQSNDSRDPFAVPWDPGELPSSRNSGHMGAGLAHFPRSRGFIDLLAATEWPTVRGLHNRKHSGLWFTRCMEPCQASQSTGRHLHIHESS